MKVKYSEQLADGRWLRKKNEILERDNYTCTRCGATSHLDIHHLYYENGKSAWEYPNDALVTLCRACHENEHGKCKPVFGEVYAKDHSDFTYFLICYGINYYKKEVYLLGIDNGASLENPVFVRESFSTFSERYVHLYNYWDYCYDEEKNYWQEILIRCLVRIYQKKDKYYDTYGFPYSKEQVYNYAYSKVWDIANSHDYLLMKFNDIANE